jgi:four helix bundle protein
MSDLFAPTPAAPAAASRVSLASSGPALLDVEKLQVYRLAVQFQTLATQLIPRQRGVLLATLRDQLDRASISIVLNIAEGAGRFSSPDKARFYGIARGSATECGAGLPAVLPCGPAGSSTSFWSQTTGSRSTGRFRTTEWWRCSAPRAGPTPVAVQGDRKAGGRSLLHGWQRHVMAKWRCGACTPTTCRFDV